MDDKTAATLQPPSSTNAPQAQQEATDSLKSDLDRSPDKPLPPPEPKTRRAIELIFRDQHSELTQNHAIVGQTLWTFTELQARKIPVADLDIPATARANGEWGIDFRPRRTSDRRRMTGDNQRLTSRLSHDLRNALACILQFGNILTGGLAGELSEEQCQYLCIMLENASRIRTLLDGPPGEAPAERGECTNSNGFLPKKAN